MSGRQADVVVIGAGIMGASCAYHLAAQGARVALLEANEGPAMESTGRSFASIRTQWADITNIQLSWESIKIYRDFESRHGVDVGYRASGYLLLVPEDRWEQQLAAVALQRSLGADVDVLTPQDAQRHTSFDTAGLGGCTWGRDDGVVDPHLVTTTYLDLARQLGVIVGFRQPVRAIEHLGDEWTLTTPTTELRARYVVNAAGGWAGEVAALANLSVPVGHVRRMIFASTPDGVSGQLPMTIDVRTGFYLRSEGSRLLMGCANPDEKAGYSTRMDWRWMETALELGVERFPWLADVPIDNTASWAGTYEVTPDHRPFLGAMPGTPTWVNACGFSGHGVMQAPMVGKVTAEEIVGGRAVSVDIDPLRIDRLGNAGLAATSLVF
ncbi:FAD-binding oxidoreductase [Kibdelosporangium persicum]|uniref:FAD-dependent catabolic D-arginine dehydrogenase DauA n=1 Tax=Kibdelosporangium persicum TaxID=2698649 RepID=A0ABX2FI93_9PSEU|nr:FAD-dependent oxidoreductase [Kibdelosporangium persicum]NRN71139.1 FAD-dependent catabolic D-arginine dehydrogenase DauA [Kibdelosporangium persicum]